MDYCKQIIELFVDGIYLDNKITKQSILANTVSLETMKQEGNESLIKLSVKRMT